MQFLVGLVAFFLFSYGRCARMIRGMVIAIYIGSAGEVIAFIGAFASMAGLAVALRKRK